MNVTETAFQPLPRSLDPLPLESLPGYLLRLAHRLDLWPSRVAVLTGLARPGGATVPASRMFALEPATTDAFARATRLSTAEVTALTLTSLSAQYPPLDPAFSGRRRQAHGIFVKETWAFFRASRYCPQCLAGDGSTIQQHHGGAWNLHWRLPVVFACLTHRRLLKHSCPACGNPAHYRRPGSRTSSMLPLAGHAGLHPAQCRCTTLTENITEQVCGTRLDQPSPAASSFGADDGLFAFQTRLSDLLRSDGPTTTSSVGQDTTPARYLLDLRILACLVAASWPAARDLAEQPQHARLLDQHVRRLRRQIREIHDSGRLVRKLGFYDEPPLEAATCAALLATADRIVTAGEVDAVRELLRPLVAHAPPSMPNWIKQFLAGDGYCSPGLHTALGLAVGAPHVMKRAGIRTLSPPPRPSGFGVQHIPQHLLPEWYEEHFARFAAEIKPRLLRRAAATRLAQMCVGGPAVEAGQLLGIPCDATTNALKVVQQQLSRRSRRGFDAAIDALADRLHAVTGLIDYGQRRQALKDWSISPDDWDELVTGLRDDAAPATRGRWPGKPFVDWGESKRILASMWVWVRITGGEHIFAPPIRPHLDRQRPGSRWRGGIHSRWAHISAEQPHGHYAPLRQRLDAYADLLTIEIDNYGTPGRSAIQPILTAPQTPDRPRRHWTHQTATTVMQKAGLEPLDRYPGTGYPWRCRCRRCGNQVTPTLSNVHRGLSRGCRYCAGQASVNPQTATEEMRHAGLLPLEPYPGTTRHPWRCRCIRCDTETLTRLTRIRAGKSRCRACHAH